MDMYSRDQYLKVIREEYLKKTKLEKGRLLDEAEKRTGLRRKYLIRKLSARSILEKKQETGNEIKREGKRRRKST